LPFFQHDQSSSRAKEGAGLGLAIAQNFCKLLNGEISVTSSVGERTYIKITFPFQPPNFDN